MRAVCLEHVAFEGPGLFAAALARRGVALKRWLVPADGVPEDPGDLLIVMGGPMSVNDPDPWIMEETALVRTALTDRRAVIGICLGSQLMAKALGAPVRRGARPEIGELAVRLTDEGRSDPVFEAYPERLSVFAWHGEVFDLPTGAVNLASSDDAPVQAFRFGRHAYGLLFHPEIEVDGIAALCRECAADLPAGRTADDVMLGMLPHLWRSHQIADRLIGHLLTAPR